jgi:hypothetical protein
MQLISELLLCDHTRVVRRKRAKGAPNANYTRQLLKAIGKVDELVTSDAEVDLLVLDREAWRSRDSRIVKENSFSNCGH